MPLFILLLAFINSVEFLKNEISPKVETPVPMPIFEAEDLYGVPISSSSLKGKIVVFNFLYNGCKPCIAELPALNKLYDEYNKKGVIFIAVNGSSKEKILNEFLKKYEFKYSIIPDGGALSKKFGADGVPANVVFDSKGIRKYFSDGGFVDERAKTEIYNKIKPVLDEILLEK